MPSDTGVAATVTDLQRRLAADEEQLAGARAGWNATKEALALSEQARERLERMIASLRHGAYGARSEKRDPDQGALPFKDADVAEGMLAAAQDKADAAVGRTARGSVPPVNRNKGRLPAHLPRIKQVIEPESTLCPCGCGEVVKVGEDRTERLDIVPARLRVLVTIRPKYICRACDGKQSAQAPAPDHLVPRGLPSEALVAHTMVSKFGDHQPFYRQAEYWRREGIDPDRTMLGNWTGRAVQVLAPVIDRMTDHLKASDRLFVDETTVPVLAPGTSKTRRDYLWAVVRDQRATDSPICEQVSERIAALYRVESMVRGKPPERRLEARRELSVPIVEALQPWLNAQLGRLSGASELARHIRYALKRWNGLTRFLVDGRVEMDNNTNPVENLIRPVPLTRKSALFAGNDDGARTWARCASLLGTCKLNGVNPQTYVTVTLRRIVDMHPMSQVDELMPWNFAE